MAADLQRPAAIQQLQVLGQQLGLPVYADLNAKDPVALCHAAVKQAKETGADVAILDTAGRLHVDAELMNQLSMIDRRVNPDQVYLVVDAMTGQDAVLSAKAFNEALELDGVIMTKLDGDARGGAALSVKAITGVPIKFVGTGEHLDSLEEFHPDRMGGRILGMGDVLTLVEQAQQKFDQEEMAQAGGAAPQGRVYPRRLQEDARADEEARADQQDHGHDSRHERHERHAGRRGRREDDMRRLVGIIDSMTPDERRNPSKVIDQSRRRRIAAGAGVEPHEVNELVKQFDGMADMMKRMSGMGMRDRMRTMQEITQGGMLNPGGQTRQTEGRDRQTADLGGESQAEETAGTRIAAKATRGKRKEVKAASLLAPCVSDTAAHYPLSN